MLKNEFYEDLQLLNIYRGALWNTNLILKNYELIATTAIKLEEEKKTLEMTIEHLTNKLIDQLKGESENE